jgi:hypothetical protein
MRLKSGAAQRQYDATHRVTAVDDDESTARERSEADDPPTIIAVLEGGPLGGQRIDADVVEGRPPKTIDVPAEDGSTHRYCLAEWAQAGPSAVYTFLYRV